MKEKFEQLLAAIKKDLIFLADMAEHNIRKSIQALKNQDVEVARQVIEKDKEIDQMEVQIEDKILTLLALQQPVAIDLRFIVGGLKMNNDLERIGDHAVNIARTVLSLEGKPAIALLKELPKMSELACNMLHEAVSAFVHRDADLARQVCSSDNEVDNFYDHVVATVISDAQNGGDNFEQSLAAVRVARSLERVADLATNIGEDVVFMKEAKIIRHHFEE